MFQCLIYLCETLERNVSGLSEQVFSLMAGERSAMLEAIFRCTQEDLAVVKRMQGKNRIGT